jgi:hypothetical protein
MKKALLVLLVAAHSILTIALFTATVPEGPRWRLGTCDVCKEKRSVYYCKHCRIWRHCEDCNDWFEKGGRWRAPK